jgi:hypothetical protein
MVQFRSPAPIGWTKNKQQQPLSLKTGQFEFISNIFFIMKSNPQKLPVLD